MRIIWVDHLLNEWARWARHRDSVRVIASYEHRISQTKDVRNGLRTVSINASNDVMTAYRIDQAVSSLPTELSSVVVGYYIDDASVSRLSKSLGVTQTTIRNRLMRSDVLIARWFEDNKKQRVS